MWWLKKMRNEKPIIDDTFLDLHRECYHKTTLNMPKTRYFTRSTMNHNHDDHKKTVGEELFEVYLRRRTPEDLDPDEHHEKRVRTKSAGEELYEIHLRRSKGIDIDKEFETEDVLQAVDVKHKK
jgi:hypothetical protein